MTSPATLAVLFDLAAISVLAYVIYYRRHRRPDLMLAYLALNIGVLTVTVALTTALNVSGTGIGLGLGLFGILSIVRLRSDQITQEEIAYYFVALVLGLLAGLHPDPWWVTPCFSTLLLTVLYAADHPTLSNRSRRQQLTLDVAHVDEYRLRAALTELLGAQITRVVPIEVDLVRDLTVVDVRYRLNP